MQSKKQTLAKDEKLVEFLSEDFRDTASHLRDTDRKIEFTFQLYAGAFSLLSSIVLSFLAFTLGGESWKVEYNIYVMVIILILSIFVWFFTLWAFIYSIKGTKMKALYMNRMNFLRNEIYKHLGVIVANSSTFLWADKLLPSDALRKVGMVDMFPLAFRYVLIFLPLPIFALLYLILMGSGFSIHWVIIIIPPIITMSLVSIQTKKMWARTVKDALTSIERSWDPTN